MNRSQVFLVVMILFLVAPPWAPAQEDVARQIEEHASKSQEYLRENKPDLAVPEFRAILSLDNQNLNANANLGVLLFFHGDFAGAIPLLQEALKIQPDLWKLQALLGTSQKRTGNLKDAVMNLESAFGKLQEKKLRIEMGLELIEADSALGLLDHAAVAATTLRQLDPENPKIVTTTYRVYSQLANESILSLAAIAPESAEMHMIMAQELVRQGSNAGALEQYREAVKIDPSLPGLHFEYAELLIHSSDTALKAQAKAEYKAALSVNNFDEKAQCGLGSIASSRGDLKEAEADYTRALDLQPNDADAKTELAKVLISRNEKDRALALLESAVQIDPTNFVAHFRLSSLYRQAGKTSDAKRELDAYQHYKSLKEKFGKYFQQMRVQANPEGMN